MNIYSIKLNYAIVALLICIKFSPLWASWNGYDWNNGSFVEIDKGNNVREGEDIEFFDYNTGEYHEMNIESIQRYGNRVEIVGTDEKTGEERTFDMD